MCPFISNKDHAQFDIKPGNHHAQFDIKPGNHNNRLENKFEGKKLFRTWTIIPMLQYQKSLSLQNVYQLPILFLIRDITAPIQNIQAPI